MLITIASNESLQSTTIDMKMHAPTVAERASPTDVKAEMLQNPKSPTVGSSLPQFNPFFTMDWLNQVDPKAMELAQQLLQTPRRMGELSKGNLTEVQKDLFTPIPTPVMKQSIAIGNGYNAKGIQKARQGAWDDALSCWEDALEIRSQILGETHVDVANTCNNIGIALGKLERADEAVSYLQRALEIRKLHYGEQHEQVAATLHNLGNVFQQDGDLSAAIQFFCECKLLQEQILGPYHAEVARACIAIGHTYYQAEALDDAREAYMDALAIFDRVSMPEDDPEVQALLDDVYDLDRQILCSFCRP